MQRRFAFLASPATRHRLLQVAVDAGLLALAYYLAFVLRFDSGVPHRYENLLEQTIVYVVVGKLFIFSLFGLYQKWWRYVGLRDFEGILKAVLASSAVLVVVMYFFSPTSETLPRSVAAMDFLLTLALISGVRFLVRSLIERPPRGGLGRKGREALIVGAGDGGMLVVREMLKNQSLGYTPVGFVDDDRSKRGLRIGGFKVLGATADLARILDDVEPDEVIIAIPSAPGELRQKVVTACRSRDIPVRTLPTVFELLRGQINLARQIRKVEVEDVLGREPVHMEIDEVGDYLKGAVVVVTGAGGSIGSELCRQIARVQAGLLVLVDHAEGGLFEIERELVEERHFGAVVPVLADCKDGERMRRVLEDHRPSVVFHAAAYKHVPLMELNPVEAVRNNAFATRTVANIAAELGVERFVLVSTDKAVNPQTVMGVSKAMAEWAMETCGQRFASTKFVSVRFGNVLGSSGSVVTVFRRQIASGGPVTVTHPEMTRYFMTIPEAVQLIINAGGTAPQTGTGGSTYVLEMGEPVNIMELARDMIALSGHEPDKDIAIEIIGPRQGEKLHEELVNRDERVTATKAEKIMRATGQPIDVDWLEEIFAELQRLACDGSTQAFAQRVLELAHERPEAAVPASL